MRNKYIKNVCLLQYVYYLCMKLLGDEMVVFEINLCSIDLNLLMILEKLLIYKYIS